MKRLEQKKVRQMTDIRFPNVKVKLIGRDGNAFSIMGAVTRALRDRNTPQEIIDEFTDEATSGDYDHLLKTITEWVDVS